MLRALWYWRWNRWRWQTPVRTGKPHSIVAVAWLIVNLLASVVAFSSCFPSQSGYSLMKGASVPLAKETRMLLSVPAVEMATLIGHSTQPVAPSHVWPTSPMFWLSFFVCSDKTQKPFFSLASHWFSHSLSFYFPTFITFEVTNFNLTCWDFQYWL